MRRRAAPARAVARLRHAPPTDNAQTRSCVRASSPIDVDNRPARASWIVTTAPLSVASSQAQITSIDGHGPRTNRNPAHRPPRAGRATETWHVAPADAVLPLVLTDARAGNARRFDGACGRSRRIGRRGARLGGAPSEVDARTGAPPVAHLRDGLDAWPGSRPSRVPPASVGQERARRAARGRVAAWRVGPATARGPGRCRAAPGSDRRSCREREAVRRGVRPRQADRTRWRATRWRAIRA